MKKKAIPPFTLTAGQSGRLLFNFTVSEGATTPTLRGALMVHNERVDMVAGDSTLTIPALPAGVYLSEVRVDGVCVLYGHVEVLPSPLFNEEGLATYRVDIDNTADVLQVNITLTEGAPGPQGEKGEPGAQGEKGEPGEAGKALAYEDLTDEQRLELVEPLVYEAATVSPAGAADNNANLYGFGYTMQRAGLITALEVSCRNNGTAVHSEEPLYVKVWRGTTLLGVSANSQLHAVGTVLHYDFAAPLAVAAGDELRVSFHTADGMATTTYQMGVQGCVRCVTLQAGESGGALNNTGGWLSQSYTAQHTWYMQVERFAPGSHTDDTSVHITAAEHAGLAELLANKDALLALLA